MKHAKTLWQAGLRITTAFRLLGFVALTVLLTGRPDRLPGEEKAARQRSTNVLLIVSEDNGPHLGCYGDSHVQTPNLDKLAAEGVRFERAFVATASCSESRSSIFTGLYPHQNGQIGLATHRYSMYQKHPNIPSLLKKEGYRTGILGKLHVNPESAFPFDFRWNDHKFCSFSHRDVHKIAGVAEQFITDSDQPFFLMVNYPDAHLPWLQQQNGIPAKPLTAKDVHTLPFAGVDGPRLRECAANYYNCIRRLDRAIGLLLEKLVKAGCAENTLVIYVGDHGAQFPRGKLSCYESGLRVPLIVRWPGRAREGLVREELVATVDILPSILDAVGAEMPGHLAGRSFLPLLREKPTEWREYLFAEYHGHYPPLYFPQRTVRDHRYKLIVNLLQDRPNPVAATYGKVMSGRAYYLDSELAAAGDDVRRVYRTWADAPPVELYDLEKDPYEFNNLAARPEYAAIQEKLCTQLEAWQKQTADPLTDPRKLARLTEEEDAQARGYQRHEKFRSSNWKYHEYLFGRTAPRSR